MLAALAVTHIRTSSTPLQSLPASQVYSPTRGYLTHPTSQAGPTNTFKKHRGTEPKKMSCAPDQKDVSRLGLKLNMHGLDYAALVDYFHKLYTFTTAHIKIY